MKDVKEDLKREMTEVMLEIQSYLGDRWLDLGIEEEDLIRMVSAVKERRAISSLMATIDGFPSNERELRPLAEAWLDKGFSAEDASVYILTGLHDAEKAAKLRDAGVDVYCLFYDQGLILESGKSPEGPAGKLLESGEIPLEEFISNYGEEAYKNMWKRYDDLLKEEKEEKKHMLAVSVTFPESYSLDQKKIFMEKVRGLISEEGLEVNIEGLEKEAQA